METKAKSIFFALSLSLAVLSSCNKGQGLLNEPQAPVAAKSAVSTLKNASLNGKYIVVMKNDASLSGMDIKGKSDKVKTKASGLLKKYEITGEVENVYESALQGFAVRLSPGQVAKLEADGEVKSIEADQEVTIDGKRSTKPAPTPTTTTTTTTTPSQNIP